VTFLDPDVKIGIKFRLTTLALAVVLMGAAIAFATLVSEQRASNLRARLKQVDSESFGIAERFKDLMREVGDKMLRYRTTRDPAAWDECLRASHELDLWIDEQKPKLKTQREKDLWQEIDRSYDDYLAAAQAVHEKIESLGPQSARLDEVSTALVPTRRRLFDLGQDLAKAHFASRNLLLTDANHTLKQLRLLVLGLLFSLFLFGIALAGVVYRDMIAPLRVELVQSRALVERHEKLASLGLLAAGVAHEIRNPLTAIKAALFIQQKKFKAGSQDHADSALMEREVLRLERIVNDFLQFARPSEPKLATVSADVALEEVRRFFAPQLSSANIQLVREESPPLWIKADLGQIKQVLFNLVQNAADSIGRDGAIVLRARPDSRYIADRETEVVVLEVSDTGKGIPAEVEGRLFDPFFTTKDTGTGLGLSIAARIIQRHGGELQYHTKINHGTTFGIVLPQMTS